MVVTRHIRLFSKCQSLHCFCPVLDSLAHKRPSPLWFPWVWQRQGWCSSRSSPGVSLAADSVNRPLAAPSVTSMLWIQPLDLLPKPLVAALTPVRGKRMVCSRMTIFLMWKPSLSPLWLVGLTIFFRYKWLSNLNDLTQCHYLAI